MASTPDIDLDYLSPSFDPASLTMPRLREILVSHDVQYPASAKKAQLVEIFKGKLLPQSRRILSARSRTKRTSKGITDVPSSQEGTVNGDDDDDEGESISLMPPPPVPDTPRRTSRKALRADTEESGEDLPIAKRPTRKSVGRTSSVKHGRSSDTDTRADAGIKRPVVRKTRRGEVAPSIKLEEAEPELNTRSANESAFSYDNPFQSGSSPASGSGRSASGDKRRKSSGPSTGKDPAKRKSFATRRKTEDFKKVKQEDGVVVPTSERFEVSTTSGNGVRIESDDHGVETGEEFTPEEQIELIKNSESGVIPYRRTKRPRKTGKVSKAAPWVVILALLGGYATWWRREKLDVGYCGVRRPSTSLTKLQIPDWASVLQPECETCPQHAYCYPSFETSCEPDFVLKPHPLSLGGLVPLPPSCEPDGEKVRRVKAVADRAVEELRERRAKWECGDLADKNGKAAPVVEINGEELKQKVAKRRRKGMSQAEFEDLWSGALGEMMGRDEVVSSVSGATNHLLLTSTSLARLPLTCAARRSARLALARYRVELAGLVLLTSLLLTARHQLTSARTARARVPQLVSVTLDRLATQATLHSQDPRAVPEPWVSVGQLRDDVLRDEFSASRREGLWKRVTDVVELNANVRANVRENRAGEVSRVWEWIGSVGAIEEKWGVGRRESGRFIGGDEAVDENVVGGREMVQKGRWDEGRPIY
ncbi:MAG: inner nuclear membrane protein enriched at telomere/subtelomere region [Pycnora praestabilis]|nr:MAG: inner nuclear membrane protein enriched at telomere/subtelomere region [Pycnora praestabilis]